MPLIELPGVPPVSPRPERQPDDYLPMQAVTRGIAFDDTAWDEERSSKIAKLFDELADEWHTRGTEERLAVTRDMLDRGGVSDATTAPPRRPRVAVEVGSGTGIHTPLLHERFDHVVSIDLSRRMLTLAPRREGVSRLRADAAHLPVAPGSVSAIICVNAFLFPAEYGRALGPGGVIGFASSSGDETPIYLPPAQVAEAFEAALGPCEVTASSHGWGAWTVVRPMTA
ncbi:MAG: class I SAM-dependent DNA methyltransferase, partial [Acidimicrobiales bacterium]